jgi:hypothetical protein
LRKKSKQNEPPRKTKTKTWSSRIRNLLIHTRKINENKTTKSKAVQKMHHCLNI